MRKMEQIINVKKLYREGRYGNKEWWTSLYMHNTPLNEIIKDYRKIDDLMNAERQPNEIFVSVKRQGHRIYFYAVPTEAMREFLNKEFFTGCNSIEFIQQRSYDPETKETTFHDEYLITCPENRIIGSRWLDYKSAFEICGFFKLGIFHNS